MSKVQEYLEKKRVEALGLPKLWLVKSHYKTGVNEPKEVQTKEIYKSGTRSYNDGPYIDVYKYRLDGYPYEIDIEDGAKSGIDHGYGTGFGDLWCWTNACFFTKEDADAFYIKENKRLEEKPIKNAIEIMLNAKPYQEILEKFAREKYNEKFKDTPTPYNSFHHYTSYDVIDNNTINVNYVYGAGDMEFNDSFKVKLD